METATIPSTESSTYFEENQECVYCGTVLWMSINICITFVAILGNTLTISAILLSKKLSTLISNHFIFSLAVSDLMVGFSIPYHMCFYLITDFGKSETKCLFRFVLTAFSCASSICNLLFIAADRYIGIVYPLHYNRFMIRKTAAILITIGWLASFAMAAVPIVWNDWRKGVKCEVVNVLPNNYLQYIVCPMFVIIWIMMILLYSRICREASGHARRIRNTANIQTAPAIKDSKSFQVMLLILGCFTICWIPYFVITLYARTTQNPSPTLYEIFFNIAVANSSMNPLIYAWKNTNFRNAFLHIVKCHRPSRLSSTIFVTNHVPSKKNSMEGISNVVYQQDVQSELDIEMQTSKMQCTTDKKNGCSLTSQVDNEILSSRTAK